MWIVPDAVTGSNELRRITTPEHIDNRRTDFYEFYWADLTNNTPFEMVHGVAQGLLLRSPFRIPNDIRIWWSWLILWVLTIILVVGCAAHRLSHGRTVRVVGRGLCELHALEGQ